MIKYETIHELLNEHDILTDGAEIHGMLTGMLAGGMSLTNQDWLPVIGDFINQGAAFPEPIVNVLNELFNGICQQLVDAEFSLDLLLPEENSPINERGLALINWVQGFQTGFALHQQNLSKCSDDVKEALEDFADIARMEEPMTDDEESEKALFEVMEYVRVSALLCFSEFGQTLIDDQDDTPAIH